MKLITATACAIAAACLATAAQAADPTHLYLMDDASDAFGGPALVSNGGSFGQGVYTFGANQGLQLTGALNADVYTLDFAVTLASVEGYRRLVDFKDLASDTGFYNLDRQLNFYDVDTGPAEVFAAGQAARVTLTRDASALVVGYVDGVQQFSFDDSVRTLATFSAAGGVAWFFQDDLIVPGEASAGQVDYIRIFDVALSASEVAALASPVPEPAAWLLMAGGLGVLLARRRR